MEISELVSRLEGVKGRDGSWSAKCPAHEDRSPSLAVKHLADGRILLHCFAGCETESILGALGVTMADLFPDGAIAHWSPRAAFSAREVLRCIEFESMYLAIAATEIAGGAHPEIDRLMEAAAILHEGARYCDGN